MSAFRSGWIYRCAGLAAVVGAALATQAAPAQAQFFGSFGYHRFDAPAAIPATSPSSWPSQPADSSNQATLFSVCLLCVTAI